MLIFNNILKRPNFPFPNEYTRMMEVPHRDFMNDLNQVVNENCEYNAYWCYVRFRMDLIQMWFGTQEDLAMFNLMAP